jgi:hypothetical protein
VWPSCSRLVSCRRNEVSRKFGVPGNRYKFADHHVHVERHHAAIHDWNANEAISDRPQLQREKMARLTANGNRGLRAHSAILASRESPLLPVSWDGLLNLVLSLHVQQRQLKISFRYGSSPVTWQRGCGLTTRRLLRLLSAVVQRSSLVSPYSSRVSRTRCAITAGSSSVANVTVRSNPSGPVMRTRKPPNGSAEIHASWARRPACHLRRRPLRCARDGGRGFLGCRRRSGTLDNCNAPSAVRSHRRTGQYVSLRVLNCVRHISH